MRLKIIKHVIQPRVFTGALEGPAGADRRAMWPTRHWTSKKARTHYYYRILVIYYYFLKYKLSNNIVTITQTLTYGFQQSIE